MEVLSQTNICKLYHDVEDNFTDGLNRYSFLKKTSIYRQVIDSNFMCLNIVTVAAVYTASGITVKFPSVALSYDNHIQTAKRLCLNMDAYSVDNIIL